MPTCGSEDSLPTTPITNHSNDAAVAFYRSTGARVANGDDLVFVYDG